MNTKDKIIEHIATTINNIPFSDIRVGASINVVFANSNIPINNNTMAIASFFSEIFLRIKVYTKIPFFTCFKSDRHIIILKVTPYLGESSEPKKAEVSVTRQ